MEPEDRYRKGGSCIFEERRRKLKEMTREVAIVIHCRGGNQSLDGNEQMAAAVVLNFKTNLE